jgi:hypothetical protein
MRRLKMTWTAKQGRPLCRWAEPEQSEESQRGMVRDLRDNGAGAITSEGQTSSWLGCAHTMRKQVIAGDTALKLAQAETSGDAATCPPVEVA